jgi:hypothetical protein
MGNQRIPGLTKRGGIWHVDKTFRGIRICESTGTGDRREAQEYLSKRMTQIREASLHGLRAVPRSGPQQRSICGKMGTSGASTTMPRTSRLWTRL